MKKLLQQSIWQQSQRRHIPGEELKLNFCHDRPEFIFNTMHASIEDSFGFVAGLLGLYILYTYRPTKQCRKILKTYAKLLIPHALPIPRRPQVRYVYKIEVGETYLETTSPDFHDVAVQVFRETLIPIFKPSQYLTVFAWVCAVLYTFFSALCIQMAHSTFSFCGRVCARNLCHCDAQI